MNLSFLRSPAALIITAVSFGARPQQPQTKAAQAPAAPVHRESPPPLGPPKNFVLPPHSTFALSNGMQVTLIPFGRVPKVTVELSLRTGKVDEGPNDVTLGAVVSDLMAEGTTTRSALDISRQAAEMGGSLNTFTGAEIASFNGEVLSDFAVPFIGLVADVALHPKFADADFKRIIDKHARDNAVALAQAGNQVAQKYREVMYGNHPFAHLFPTEEMLRAFTVQRVKDYYTKNYTAKRAHIYVSGVFDRKAVEKAIREGFSAWEAGAPPTENPPTVSTKQQVAVVDRANSVQSAMMMGVAVADPKSPDWIKMNVTDALLGGAFGSRITTNIREDKGYTYSPFSFLLTRKGSSIWTEQADVTTNVTGASLTEIFKEIDKIRTEAPPAKELEGIKNNMAGIFTIQNSSRYGLIDQIAFADVHGLGDGYVTNYVKNVHAVTPEDVRATATKYIDPKKMSIAIVGDKKSVDAQLGKVKTILP